jgi:hypothetical protein
MELLGRYLLQKRDIRVRKVNTKADLTLDIRPGIGKEGFCIEATGGAVRLVGNDERGLIYAVGKYLRDPQWRGTSVPEKPVRGIFFATHFHNIYNDGPVEFIQRYVEELALWGCNGLCVWFDMHHYTGMDDPAAKAMIARLRAVFQTASSCGISPWLTSLSNEAFASSPKELRADFSFGSNGYRSDIGAYGVELCPNKPGGLEKILEYRGQVLAAFQDLDIGLVSMGPYDQGGCTCASCAPWGANGYLKTAEAVSRQVHEFFPKAKFVLNTWYFDKHTDGEWEGLSRAFAVRPDWVDYLMADNAGSFPEYPLKHGVPGGLPAAGFPEISMMPMWPWGGFGANPRLNHWQNYWDGVRHLLAGGMAYSEGIYEDINKAIHLQHCWDSDRTSREIAREYAAYEFNPACADNAVRLMEDLEVSLDHSISQDAVISVLQNGGWKACRNSLPVIYHQPNVKNPAVAMTMAKKIDEQMSPGLRAAWRWRVLWLRAALDEELFTSKGRPTARSDAYFAELRRIYHADKAEWIVSAPGTQDLNRLFKDWKAPARLPNVDRGPQYSPFLETWKLSKLMPKTVAGAPAVSLADPLEWKPLSVLNGAPGFINVHMFFPSEDGIAYLATRVRVKKAGEWNLHVGHDGGIRAFVDGRDVLTVPERINPSPVFRSKAKVRLEKGDHEIVIALDTDGGKGWGICSFFESLAKTGRHVFPQPVPIRKSRS